MCIRDRSVGVVKNIAYMASITGYSDPNCIYDYIKQEIVDLNDESKPTEYFHDKVKVMFNGRWVGVAINPIELYRSLKEKKYKGFIHIYTSITFNMYEKIIYIYNDSGRLVRPVYKMKNNELLITKEICKKLDSNELNWDDLLVSHTNGNSVIEYIYSEEQKY